jgi:hypothetical protein
VAERIALGIVCTLFAVTGAAQEPNAEQSQRVEQWETAFARARDMELVHTLEALPVDVRRKLTHVVSGAVAEFGAQWHSSGNVDDPKMPIAQHLFSAVSRDVFVVVFLSSRGEWKPGRGVVLMLGRSDFAAVCTYTFGELPVRNLRIDTFQYYLDARIAPRDRPSCQYQEIPASAN